MKYFTYESSEIRPIFENEIKKVKHELFQSEAKISKLEDKNNLFEKFKEEIEGKIGASKTTTYKVIKFLKGNKTSN